MCSLGEGAADGETSAEALSRLSAARLKILDDLALLARAWGRGADPSREAGGACSPHGGCPNGVPATMQEMLKMDTEKPLGDEAWGESFFGACEFGQKGSAK